MASSRSPCQTWATMPTPSIASTMPNHIARGSRVRRASRTHSAISTGEVNSSRIAMPTGNRPTETK